MFRITLALVALALDLSSQAALAARVVPPRASPPCHHRRLTPPGVVRGHLVGPAEMPVSDASCEGQLAYTDRPARIRAIMRRMYQNDRDYRTFSAVFVDHAPGDQPGSVRIDIRQPDSDHVAVYTNQSGTGTPAEYRLKRGNDLYLYAPAQHAYTVLGSSSAPSQLVPLDTLPAGVTQEETGGTTFGSGGPSSGPTSLADLFVHPAALITSPLFENKQVRLTGASGYAGRSTWELYGTQLPTARTFDQRGNAWRMWVDQQTGIVLRLVYYAGPRVAGWAEMLRVRIDGVGPAPDAGTAALSRWSVPPDAEYQDPLGYGELVTSKPAPPFAWLRDHSDVIAGLVLIFVLLMIRRLLGRGGRAPLKDAPTTAVAESEVGSRGGS